MIIKAVGIDAAFANMGFVKVLVDTELLARAAICRDAMPPSSYIKCESLCLVSTVPEQQKVVRKSSDRLRRGAELRQAMLRECTGCTFAFVEVPSGTQNANAAFGLGIAVGILSGCPVPIIEVSQQEVKTAVAGMKVKKGASKAEIIEWASKLWPDANWHRAPHKSVSKGRTLPAGRLTEDNEHLADALATVVAGVATPEFQRLITLMAASNAIPHTSSHRPAPNRPARSRIPLGSFRLAGEDLP